MPNIITPSYKPTLALRLTVWLISLMVVVGLGVFRVATDAQFTFFSLTVMPILLIAWIGSFAEAAWFATLATGSGLWPTWRLDNATAQTGYLWPMP